MHFKYRLRCFSVWMLTLLGMYSVVLMWAKPGSGENVNEYQGHDLTTNVKEQLAIKNLRKAQLKEKYPTETLATKQGMNPVKVVKKRTLQIKRNDIQRGNQLTTTETITEFIPHLNQDNPKLVAIVRQSLHQPALAEEPYNLSSPHTIHFSQLNQSVYLTQELLKGVRDGIFVELGAFDGEVNSNTLYLERELGWKGLLIEPDPANFKKLIMKRRKAFAINAGASLTNKSAIVYFQQAIESDFNRISDDSTPDVIPIKTFPLYTMLFALNISMVDFLSIDIEGDELKVLKTLPWDKINMRVMCVEVNHTEEGVGAVVSYLESQGYVLLDLRGIDAWFGNKELLEQQLGRKLVKTYMELDVEDYS